MRDGQDDICNDIRAQERALDHFVVIATERPAHGYSACATCVPLLSGPFSNIVLENTASSH